MLVIYEYVRIVSFNQSGLGFLFVLRCTTHSSFCRYIANRICYFIFYEIDSFSNSKSENVPLGQLIRVYHNYKLWYHNITKCRVNSISKSLLQVIN